jgi:hypothetical protein
VSLYLPTGHSETHLDPSLKRVEGHEVQTVDYVSQVKQFELHFAQDKDKTFL